MKEETRKVRHAGEVVDEVSVPVYETVDELVNAETEERVLAMFNKQNAVRIMGNVRAQHTPSRMGKGKMWDLAFNMLSPEEAASFAGNVEGLREFLESDEIAERVKKSLEEGGDQ